MLGDSVRLEACGCRATALRQAGSVGVNRGQRVATGRSGGRLATLVCLVAIEAGGEVGWRRVDLVGLVCHDDERLFLEALVVIGCVVLVVFLLRGWLWRGAIVGCAHVCNVGGGDCCPSALGERFRMRVRSEGWDVGWKWEVG
jgi:hypothetical protein